MNGQAMNCPNCGKELSECAIVRPDNPDKWLSAWACTCAPKDSLPRLNDVKTMRVLVKGAKPFQQPGKVRDLGVVVGGADDPLRHEPVEGREGNFG